MFHPARPIGSITGLIATAWVLVFAAPAGARDDIRVERIRFEPGATGAVVEASLRGYETVDYLVGARAGQAMNVGMASDNTANYFNILAPGEDAVALFNGSMGENQYEGMLPATGDYKLRVYLMRSAARRNEVANYRLELSISDGGRDAKSALEGDALVPGTGFHAVGEVPCSMNPRKPTASCPFGVTRKGGGSGTVTITRPDGAERLIYFKAGRATGSDASEADGDAFRASRTSDLTTVHVGDERYEIPDAVIFGG